LSRNESGRFGALKSDSTHHFFRNASNSEQSYKGKVKTHKYINRQNQSTTENCENRNDPDLVQAFLKKWWVESDFKAHVKNIFFINV
jgi:hypothetical protein